MAAVAEQSKTYSNFNGSRRTQSGAERNVTGDIEICSRERLSRLTERPGDAQWIIGPVLFPQGRQGIQAGLDRFIEILGMDDKLAIAARSHRRPAIEFNRGWQHEAVVIVGVLSNQVHAPGCAVNVRGRAKARLERVQKLQGCLQRRLLSLICSAFTLRICGQN